MRRPLNFPPLTSSSRPFKRVSHVPMMPVASDLPSNPWTKVPALSLNIMPSLKRVSQIGGDTDMEWARMHFECGLHKGIRRHVTLNAPINATLNELATLGQRAYDFNQQLAKESTRSQMRPANSTPGPPGTALSSHPETFCRTISASPTSRLDHLGFLTTRTSHGPFPKLVGDDDRVVLRKVGICFKCRQPGHMSTKCLDRSKGACKGNITGDSAGWSAFEFQPRLSDSFRARVQNI